MYSTDKNCDKYIYQIKDGIPGDEEQEKPALDTKASGNIPGDRSSCLSLFWTHFYLKVYELSI